jgi:hypothetical protein
MVELQRVEWHCLPSQGGKMPQQQVWFLMLNQLTADPFCLLTQPRSLCCDIRRYRHPDTPHTLVT